MAYLGRGLDKISNIEVLDNITFDGSSSYSITKGSVAFTPNSAQSLLISIDGVVQATNFTVNSSTIDFGVAIPSTSVCNFFLHYGTGVMTVPSDGSVTTAKLGDDAVTGAKITDGSVTSGKLASGVLPTNTPAFFVKKGSNQTLSDQSNSKVIFDTVEIDTHSGFDNTTNYRYTIPTGEDGKYLFFFHAQVSSTTASQARELQIRLRRNGSNFFHSSDKPYINDATRVTMSASIIRDCSEGDYIELFAQMDVGSGSVSVEAYTKGTCFGGYKLIGV